MQLPLNQLTTQLAKGLRALYTVYGDEALLVQEAVDTIRSAARAAGFTERSSFTVAGAHFDWGGVLAASGSLSLFADKQIIEVRIPTGKPGKDGSTALQQLAASSAGNDSTLTIVILPRLDKATKTGAWFAALDANGATVPVDSIERAALPQWIAQRLQQQGQHVKSGDEGQRTLAFFADRVEGNLLAAHQEIQKLGLLYPQGELGFEQVEQAVLNVARYDVFKLSDAVLGGHVALKIFAGFIVSLVGVALAGGTGLFALPVAALSLGMVIALTALEFLVAFLQAFVFAVLACIYLNDVVNLGHGH